MAVPIPPTNHCNYAMLLKAPKCVCKHPCKHFSEFLVMQTRHLISRGNSFQYVRRVPRDIISSFPSATIWKSLKTKDAKGARLLADKWEFLTQQLFLQLRTEMLSKDLEKMLVARFLKRGTEALEARAKDQPIAEMSPHTSEANDQDEACDAAFEILGKAEELTPKGSREKRAVLTQDSAHALEELIADKDTLPFFDLAKGLAENLHATRGIKMTPREVKDLILPLMNAQKQLTVADYALLRGDWAPMEALKSKASSDLETPYFDLKTAIDKYRSYYLASKTTVKPGTIADMEVECRVLLDIVGNLNIADVNTMDTLTSLKKTLLRYPLNKIQRFGDRSIHGILKTEKNYAVVSPKTANEYIVRMTAIIDYANKSKMLNAANVFRGENFHTDTAAEEQRSAYTNKDIIRLVDAICTEHLWIKSPPRPERFWIILIALFHGFRLGNIVALTKRDICQTDHGMWIFQLRAGKTKSTVRPVAICDSLLLLGFLEWVETLSGNRLFQDSSRSFSAWYNRNEMRDGKPVLGFESMHVTTDRSKCLYSLRHSFGGNIFDVTSDYKITADMMGHSTDKSVTARYTKRSKAETLKEISEKMHIEHIDLDKLETRAKELFDLQT